MNEEDFCKLRESTHFYEEQIQSKISFAYRQLEKIAPNHKLLAYFSYDDGKLNLFPRSNLSTTNFYEDYGVEFAGDGKDKVRYLCDLFEAIGKSRGKCLPVTRAMGDLMRTYLELARELSIEIDCLVAAEYGP